METHFNGMQQQQQLAGVLIGLLYKECELYMDDIHNATLNPEKSAIGMDRVEYVGHLIDAEEIHFTRIKLDNITRFEEPKTMFEVTFPGTRELLSVLAIPLQKLVVGYTKSMRNWKIKLEGSGHATLSILRI
jgi:hypothetical protein